MAYFGRAYDAPVYDTINRLEGVPVGERCVFCVEEIHDGQDGFRYVSGEYVHLYCNLRAMLGKEMADIVIAKMTTNEEAA